LYWPSDGKGGTVRVSADFPAVPGRAGFDPDDFKCKTCRKCAWRERIFVALLLGFYIRVIGEIRG